jgi:hypothetical protein
VVDVVYMFMNLSTHVIQGERGAGRLVVHSALGIILDISSAISIYRRSCNVLRCLVFLHISHFIGTLFTGWQIIAVFRVLVILFLERVWLCVLQQDTSKASLLCLECTMPEGCKAMFAMWTWQCSIDPLHLHVTVQEMPRCKLCREC